MATKTISEITINKIRIGGKAPKAIHKGGVEVKEVKKGSTVVYKKEDVTYTLAQAPGSATSISASGTTIVYKVTSYKGSSTAVPVSYSIVGNGGGTVASCTQSGTTYTITVNISANTSIASKTHMLGISHADPNGNGVQSITLTCTQSGINSTTYKINFYFCNWLYGTYVQSANFNFVKQNGTILTSSIGGGIQGVSAGWVTQRTITFSDTTTFTGYLESMENTHITDNSGGFTGWWQIKVTTSASQPSSVYDGTQIFYCGGVGQEITDALTAYNLTATSSGTNRYMWLCQS